MNSDQMTKCHTAEPVTTRTNVLALRKNRKSTSRPSRLPSSCSGVRSGRLLCATSDMHMQPASTSHIAEAFNSSMKNDTTAGPAAEQIPKTKF